MLVKTTLMLAALALSADLAAAKPLHVRKLHPRVVESAPYGGTLVLHPASNIACNTSYRATRALPCDQPVWVYGRPCELDIGLGHYRSCD